MYWRLNLHNKKKKKTHINDAPLLFTYSLQDEAYISCYYYYFFLTPNDFNYFTLQIGVQKKINGKHSLFSCLLKQVYLLFFPSFAAWWREATGWDVTFWLERLQNLKQLWVKTTCKDTLWIRFLLKPQPSICFQLLACEKPQKFLEILPWPGNKI